MLTAEVDYVLYKQHISSKTIFVMAHTHVFFYVEQRIFGSFNVNATAIPNWGSPPSFT